MSLQKGRPTVNGVLFICLCMPLLRFIMLMHGYPGMERRDEGPLFDIIKLLNTRLGRAITRPQLLPFKNEKPLQKATTTIRYIQTGAAVGGGSMARA